MRSLMQQSTSGILIVGFSVLVGFTLVARHAGAVSPSDSNPATHSSEHNWDKKLPSASRFTTLSAFGDAAVRDDETGLVWEKTLEAAEMAWSDARTFCADKDVGRRKGWHVWCVRGGLPADQY